MLQNQVGKHGSIEENANKTAAKNPCPRYTQTQAIRIVRVLMKPIYSGPARYVVGINMENTLSPIARLSRSSHGQYA